MKKHGISLINYYKGDKKMTYEEIKKANEKINSIDVKGKQYAEVNQRIKAFRMVCPNGTISTEIIELSGDRCVMKATVSDCGNILGTGTAYEIEGNTFINKTSFIENCETSAVGRALGMCGFGIDTSIASFEEVSNAIENQKNYSTEIKAKTITLAKIRGVSEEEVTEQLNKKANTDKQKAEVLTKWLIKANES